MIQELLGGAMEQMKSSNPHPALPLVVNPSPTSSSTSSRSSATSSPSAAGAAAPQQSEPLRCPRCNSSNTKFCYYNNYNLTQPRHFCKTCRRYWTKGGALRNVPIGGGCRKPRPLPAPAKPATCKGTAPMSGGAQLGLGVGVGMGMGMHGASPISWASPHTTAQLMALLNSTRACAGAQNHSRNFDHHTNVQKLLGLDSMGHLHISPSTGGGSAGASLWPQQARPMPPSQMEQQHGMGVMGHEMLPGLGLKSSSLPAAASASYYSDQLHAVIGNVGHVYDPSSLSCTTTTVSVPATTTTANVSVASTVGLEAVPLAGAAADLAYWSSPAMPAAWSDLPTSNGAFP